MKASTTWKAVLAAALMATGAGAETVINGSRRILGNWDASQAGSTKAARQAAGDPATCAEGEIYYNTTAHKHRQCVQANQWADLGQALPQGTAGQVYMSDGSGVRAVTAGPKIAADGTSLKYTIADLTSIDIRDDFIPRTSYSGALGWLVSASGTLYAGVSSASVADPQYGSRSRITIKTNPPALTQGGLYLGPYLNIGPGGAFRSWELGALTWHDTTAVDTAAPTDYAFQFGFNVNSPIGNYGVMVIYDPAGNAWGHGCGASPNWRFWVRNLSPSTICLDSGIPVQAQTKYRLRIWSPGSGTVYMSVDDTRSPAITTGLPSVDGQSIFINCMTLQTGTQKSFDVARFAFHVDGLLQ